jgi:uncharacterized membrane protein
MRALYLASVFLHVTAAMTWVGGMVVFVAGVMPYFRDRPDDKAMFLGWFGRRFRAITWACFGILAVTGTFNLWSRGVRVEHFLLPEWRSSPFGHLVLAKLGLVVVALVVSAAHERIAAPGWARWMGRALLIIGLAAVAAAVMLVRGI